MRDSSHPVGHPNLDQILPGPVPHSSPCRHSLMLLSMEEHQDTPRDHRTLSPLWVLFLGGQHQFYMGIWQADGSSQPEHFSLNITQDWADRWYQHPDLDRLSHQTQEEVLSSRLSLPHHPLLGLSHAHGKVEGVTMTYFSCYPPPNSHLASSPNCLLCPAILCVAMPVFLSYFVTFPLKLEWILWPISSLAFSECCPMFVPHAGQGTDLCIQD